jgi:hypothetical protein
MARPNHKSKKKKKRPSRRWEEVIKMDLAGSACFMWKKFSWLRINRRAFEKGNKHSGVTKHGGFFE